MTEPLRLALAEYCSLQLLWWACGLTTWAIVIAILEPYGQPASEQAKAIRVITIVAGPLATIIYTFILIGAYRTAKKINSNG